MCGQTLKYKDMPTMLWWNIKAKQVTKYIFICKLGLEIFFEQSEQMVLAFLFIHLLCG